MDLTSKDVIQKLCRAYNISPLRECGQNFLISRDVLDDMVEAADLKKDDIILEVGPGFGTLTLELAKRVKKVIAVEQDKILIKELQENLKKEKKKKFNRKCEGGEGKTTPRVSRPPQSGARNDRGGFF